jgi:hypothetical protein
MNREKRGGRNLTVGGSRLKEWSVFYCLRGGIVSNKED